MLPVILPLHEALHLSPSRRLLDEDLLVVPQDRLDRFALPLHIGETARLTASCCSVSARGGRRRRVMGGEVSGRRAEQIRAENDGEVGDGHLVLVLV
jgi:hypothetical protein